MSDAFLSGTSGEISGIRATTRAVLADALCDATAAARLDPPRLRRAAGRVPARHVLALAIEHEDRPTLLAPALAELHRSRHRLTAATATVGGRGKFENLGRLLAGRSLDGVDWLLVLDDDVRLPSGFLDRFLFLAERFALGHVQPAHRRRSHAAWAVTRRWPGTVARQTRFVEIGPVFALHRTAFAALLPFPPLRFGWGLDLHWSALAATAGVRQGVIDATPIAHAARRVAVAYPRQAAIAEARAFLAERPFLPREAAARTVAAYRSWR